MSLPSFPEKDSVPSREEVINQIISSIAMEELGLSHLINAEGEKLQYALGTIPGISGPTEPLTIDDLIALNKGVQNMLDSTMMNQFFLKEKLLNALSASIMQGPTGPTGPQGPATIAVDPDTTLLEPGASPTVENIGSSRDALLKFGIPGGATGATGATGPSGAMAAFGAQAALYAEGTEVEVPVNGNVIFDTVSESGLPDISYNETTGIFTINQSGQRSIYLINWWVFVEGSSEAMPTIFAIYEGNVKHSQTSCSWPDTQIIGSDIISLDENQTNVEVSLRNIGTTAVTLSDFSDKAQITIMGFRRV